MKNILKSVGAVFAGMLVIIILSVVTDQILEQGKIFASIPLVLALVYRTVFAILGGYVTAMLAPSKHMKHVVVLTVIGSILGTLGALANWGKSDEWYPILLVVFSFFAVLAGGKLYTPKSK